MQPAHMFGPIAYLTCEIKGRDFPSRLEIAEHLLKQGFAVVVGQQWGMIVNLLFGALPKGCVLFKTSNKIQTDLMRQCRKMGNAVLASDEECLPASVEEYSRTTDPDIANSCDLFLAINAEHRDSLTASYPALRDKIVVTGTARVDVLRRMRPRPRQNDYILVNTSFGTINSIWGDTQTAAAMWITAGGHPPGPETTLLVDTRIAFERAALVETCDLVDTILKTTHTDVIIRPHPGERATFWEDRYASNRRVSIVARSDPALWAQHASLVVHNESTTGVEAAIIGTPALNLSPPSKWSDLLVVKDVNVTVPTAAAANTLIQALLNDGTWPSTERDIGRLFPSGGAERTAEVITSMLPPPELIRLPNWKHVQRTDVWKDKFTVSLSEIRALVKDCNVTELDDSVFLLSPPLSRYRKPRERKSK